MATEITEEILEETSRVYNATIQDETGAAIALARIDAITLTLYDVATDGIINSRSNQNVLNTNNVTIGATDGSLQWQMQPADNAIVTTGKARERHRALFQFTYDTTKKGKHEVDFFIRNLNKVP